MRGSKTGKVKIDKILITPRRVMPGYYMQVLYDDNKTDHYTVQSFYLCNDDLTIHPFTEKMVRLNYNIEGYKVEKNTKRQEILIYKD